MTRPVTQHSKDLSALAAAERRLTEQLPGLVDTAVESYRNFAEAEPPGDAKSYAARQAACKAALAHLDLLLRLARMLLPKAAAEAAPDLETLIVEARARAGLNGEGHGEGGEGA